MTLVEKVNKELGKVGLEFKVKKELVEKFKGTLVDKKANIEIPYEVEKILQWNRVKSFAASCRTHIDMYIQLEKLQKQED